MDTTATTTKKKKKKKKTGKGGGKRKRAAAQGPGVEASRLPQMRPASARQEIVRWDVKSHTGDGSNTTTSRGPFGQLETAWEALDPHGVATIHNFFMSYHRMRALDHDATQHILAQNIEVADASLSRPGRQQKRGAGQDTIMGLRRRFVFMMHESATLDEYLELRLVEVMRREWCRFLANVWRWIVQFGIAPWYLTLLHIDTEGPARRGRKRRHIVVPCCPSPVQGHVRVRQAAGEIRYNWTWSSGTRPSATSFIESRSLADVCSNIGHSNGNINSILAGLTQSSSHIFLFDRVRPGVRHGGSQLDSNDTERYIRWYVETPPVYGTLLAGTGGLIATPMRAAAVLYAEIVDCEAAERSHRNWSANPEKHVVQQMVHMSDPLARMIKGDAATSEEEIMRLGISTSNFNLEQIMGLANELHGEETRPRGVLSENLRKLAVDSKMSVERLERLLRGKMIHSSVFLRSIPTLQPGYELSHMPAPSFQITSPALRTRLSGIVHNMVGFPIRDQFVTEDGVDSGGAVGARSRRATNSKQTPGGGAGASGGGGGGEAVGQSSLLADLGVQDVRAHRIGRWLDETVPMLNGALAAVWGEIYTPRARAELGRTWIALTRAHYASEGESGMERAATVAKLVRRGISGGLVYRDKMTLSVGTTIKLYGNELCAPDVMLDAIAKEYGIPRAMLRAPPRRLVRGEEEEEEEAVTPPAPKKKQKTAEGGGGGGGGGDTPGPEEEAEDGGGRRRRRGEEEREKEGEEERGEAKEEDGEVMRWWWGVYIDIKR